MKNVTERLLFSSHTRNMSRTVEHLSSYIVLQIEQLGQLKDCLQRMEIFSMLISREKRRRNRESCIWKSLVVLYPIHE